MHHSLYPVCQIEYLSKIKSLKVSDKYAGSMFIQKLYKVVKSI